MKHPNTNKGHDMIYYILPFYMFSEITQGISKEQCGVIFMMNKVVQTFENLEDIRKEDDIYFPSTEGKVLFSGMELNFPQGGSNL